MLWLWSDDVNTGCVAIVMQMRCVAIVGFKIVSYLKEDCSDLHVIYVLYLYKYICILLYAKAGCNFLIKRKDQFKFMY